MGRKVCVARRVIRHGRRAGSEPVERASGRLVERSPNHGDIHAIRTGSDSRPDHSQSDRHPTGPDTRHGVPRRAHLDRGARQALGGDHDRDHPHRRDRAERAAHGAGQAQLPGPAQGGRDGPTAGRRAGRAGDGLRARGQRRSTDRPHAVPRHDHDAARSVRAGPGVRGAQPPAARVRRHRADGRQRRQPGVAGGGGRAAQCRVDGLIGARAPPDRLLPGAGRRVAHRAGRARGGRRIARRHARHVDAAVPRAVAAARRPDGARQPAATAAACPGTRHARPPTTASRSWSCRSTRRCGRFGDCARPVAAE